MGCGCNKRRGVNGEIVTSGISAGRKAVYQVVKDGQVVSEFSTPMEARKAASEVGARVRISSQAMTP